ncbi:MAG TPA: insulinase family protein, partial [Chroococcales cyanobacterium]
MTEKVQRIHLKRFISSRKYLALSAALGLFYVNWQASPAFGQPVKQSSPLLNGLAQAAPGTGNSTSRPTAAAGSGAATPGGTSVAGASTLKSGKVQQVVLPNGLRVLLVEDHSFPVLSLVVFYKVGARNEQSGMTGLSHVVEHLLFENVGTFRKGELGATIVRNGGQFNGFTSDDFTAFFETVQPSKLALILRIEAERMRRAHFTQQDLKEEVAKIHATIDEQAGNPQEQLVHEVRATAYTHHPYRNPPIGYKPDLEALTLEDVRSYYDRFYYPDNATLVLAGDFKSASALTLINKYFAALPKAPGAIPQVRAVEPVQQSERKVVMHYSGKRDIIQLAYHAPAFSNSDAPSMVVLEKLLNMDHSGKLRAKLIDAKVAGSARCAFELKRDPGLFTLTFNVPPGGQQKVLEAWESLIGQIKAQGVSDADLRRARNQAHFSVVTERDGPYHTAFDLGFCESLQSWQVSAQLPQKLTSVTSIDLKRVAQKYFNSNNRVVGLLAGPPLPPPPPKASLPKDSKALLDSQMQNQLAAEPRHVHHCELVGLKSSDSSLDDHAGLPAHAPILPAARQPLAPKLALPAAERAESGGVPAAGRKTAQSNATASAGSGTAEAPLSESSGSEPAPPAQAKMPLNGKLDTAAPPSATTVPAKPATRPASGSGTTAHAATPAPHVEPPRQLLQTRTLSNGLTLYLFESHLCPIVQIHGLLFSGRVFDPAGKRGISDVAVALLNNGSGKTSRAQLVQAQEDIGLLPQALLKFENGEQYINFKARCLSADLSTELNLIASVLKEPAPQDADVEKAKQDVINSIKQCDDSVTLQVDRALLRSLIAPGTAYYPGDLAERARSLSNLKTSDLKDYMTLNFAPTAATLVIAGDITMAEAAAIAERSFGSWKGDAPARSLPRIQANPHRIVKSSIPLKEKNKSYVCMGRLVELKNDPGQYDRLLFADCALTNHPIFSRLAQRINNEPTVIGDLSPDEIQSRFLPLSDSLIWTLNLPVEPNVVPKAVTSVQAELRKFGRAGLTPEEFAEIKRYLLGALPVKQAASTADIASAAADGLQQGLSANLSEDVVARIKQMSIDEINRFIHNDFKPDLSSLVV